MIDHTNLIIADKVLKDILVNFPIISNERTFEDEIYNIISKRVEDVCNNLKTKYEDQANATIAEEAERTQ